MTILSTGQELPWNVRVVLLDGGRIVADGTHDELMRTSPLYVEVLAQAEDEDLDREDVGAADGRNL